MMSASRDRLFRRLARELGPDEWRMDDAARREHAGDKWFASSLPEAVALPRSTASVARVLRFADRHGIPVTPRGAGHGYVGGCVPVRGGVVLPRTCVVSGRRPLSSEVHEALQTG